MRLASAAILAGIALLPASASAGLYYSGETYRELPAQWSGFLPDHRALRGVAVPKFDATGSSSPLRDTYADAALKLETAAKSREMSADESADLGALYIRLGKPEKAIEVLRAASRKHPEHFQIAANLGTAWQVAGDLPQAVAALEDAVRLASDAQRDFEKLHLRLVRGRVKAEKNADGLDPLFEGKYPENAAALVQRLALSLPADGRLLWQLGEIARSAGDIRTAANILDGCVTEFGLKSTELREHRQAYRTEADRLEKAGKHRQPGTIAFRSSRPLLRSFDPAKLPPIQPEGENRLPWPALTETEIGKGFKPAFLKHVADLDGKRVTLTGYMTPSAGQDTDVRGFLLTENPIGCWFCEVPGPTQLVSVEPQEGKAVEFVRGVVKVTGILKLNRTDPETYVFTLSKAQVSQPD